MVGQLDFEDEDLRHMFFFDDSKKLFVASTEKVSVFDITSFEIDKTFDVKKLNITSIELLATDVGGTRVAICQARELKEDEEDEGQKIIKVYDLEFSEQESY